MRAKNEQTSGQSMFQTPILLIVFNRPEPTRQVLARIREIRPKQLFVAADGPRGDRDADEARCTEVRAVISELVDWPCELTTRYREENVGCGTNVSQAISWFFEQVDRGIILEDDIVPDPSFFPFCERLLDLYADDQRIFQIGGANPVPSRFWSTNDSSYHYSSYNQIWGWATWRRAWQHYRFDLDLADLTQLLETWRSFYKFDRAQVTFWSYMFRRMARKEIDTWDYQFTFAMWLNRAYSVMPSSNLVQNIGFGADATHTKEVNDLAKLVVEPVDLPLVSPAEIAAKKDQDNILRDVSYRIPRSTLGAFYRGGIKPMLRQLKRRLLSGGG